MKIFPAIVQSALLVTTPTLMAYPIAAVSEADGISPEENGRIIGSLFAHQAVDSLSQNPAFATELKDFGFNSQYPLPGWLQTYPDSSAIMPHPSTDLAFFIEVKNVNRREP